MIAGFAVSALVAKVLGKQPPAGPPRPVQLEQQPDGRLAFVCTRGDCRFQRSFGTLGGAKRGVSQHALDEHGVRLFWQDPA